MAKTKLDYYVVNCETCRMAFEDFGPRPVLARRAAKRHAETHSGHEAIVINVRRLTVPWRYLFVQLSEPEKPPF